MALLSPGVQVTVIDESQYQPTASGTIAYVLLATEQDKLNSSGTIATYTTKANAGKLLPIGSQRELVSTLGAPKFQLDASGNPIHAHELSEYGLLAAYSALGVANKVYVQRADVDLKQLTGTSIRPTGVPADGTYWLDLANTDIGAYEWASAGLVKQTPLLITSAADLTGSVPNASVGTIGSYAVNTTITTNPVYYKDYANVWQLVGSDGWMKSHPTVTGTVATPVAGAGNLSINGTLVAISASAPVSSIATSINSAAITGVTATVNTTNQLELRITSLSNSSTGTIVIAAGTGTTTVDIGLVVGTYHAPVVQFSDYRTAPTWRATDLTPRPYGSLWLKTSAVGAGASFGIKQYSTNLNSWILLSAPLYTSDTAAVYGLDAVGGGGQLPIGTLYVKYDVTGDNTGTFKAYVKNVAGLVKVTGTIPVLPYIFVIGNSFTMEVSVPGSLAPVTKLITLTGTTSASLVGDILAANFANISAVIESSGAISINHLAGGTIKFTYGTGTPLTTAGLMLDANVQTITGGSVYLASPFTALAYTYSTTAPYTNPIDGTLWYYNSALEADIMIHTGGGWVGYKSAGAPTNEARGYTLLGTDPLGPIMAAVKPTTQVSGAKLVPGELWINTGDLENYPVIHRYAGAGVWNLIDNTDQVTTDGIVFADARWGTSASINPVTATLPSIVDLQSSPYLDADAPDYRLYARGTLLFNTRRSGYSVKQFVANHLPLAAQAASWVTHSGNDEMGVSYFGHKAQRNVIVTAMKAAIESSTALREEQVQYNLIVCPGYPELIQNMVTLNNDRKNTAFIIGDSPMTLNSSTASIETWASNQQLAQDNGLNGLVSNSEYMGAFYPSGLGTDLSGHAVVVPPSHMMLRTIIRSDNVSYPWFAPAGVRRGLIDNASSIGYVDTTDGYTFKSIGVSNSLRDVLYTQRVNPITVLPGVGLVNYGQKTRAAMTSAMDRINVARLVCYLRVVLDQVARPYIFEPNDTITRNQIKRSFEAVLNDITAKRGIYDYLVVCDTSNNTTGRIDRNELWIDIAIEPVKAIEFVYIPVRLRNTGAIAAGL